MHTVIIGGGAAGMTAAIAAAQAGQRVTVLERGRKVLKKLGVTGNGRGNLLNNGRPQYYGDEAFALRVLKSMPYERIAAFLRDCGIALTEEDEGRMYPACYLAGAAVDALRLRAERLGVRVEPNIRVTALKKCASGFVMEALRSVYAEDTPRKSGKMKPGALLREEPANYEADRVIVTVGGAASPMHGTDGTSYGLLTAFGHRLIDPRPALCALLTEKAEGLSGQRVRAALHLYQDGTLLHASCGEALFADDGVSGIAAMQLARFVQPGCVLDMDLREAAMGDERDRDVTAWLTARAQNARTLGDVLVGAAPPALSAALLRRAGLRPDGAPAASSLSGLAQQIRSFRLTVLGTRGFEMAQVTAGGVDTAQFSPQTLQSELEPGLYAAGEVLNVDGACGGFNLMFAFASGLLAGSGTNGPKV